MYVHINIRNHLTDYNEFFWMVPAWKIGSFGPDRWRCCRYINEIFLYFVQISHQKNTIQLQFELSTPTINMFNRMFSLVLKKNELYVINIWYVYKRRNWLTDLNSQSEPLALEAWHFAQRFLYDVWVLRSDFWKFIP